MNIFLLSEPFGSIPQPQQTTRIFSRRGSVLVHPTILTTYPTVDECTHKKMLPTSLWDKKKAPTCDVNKKGPKRAHIRTNLINQSRGALVAQHL
jgi:hypothetical protein